MCTNGLAMYLLKKEIDSYCVIVVEIFHVLYVYAVHGQAQYRIDWCHRKIGTPIFRYPLRLKS